MQRRLYLIWKDKRSGGWTRRARLYLAPPGGMWHRVAFEDTQFSCSAYFETLVEAESAIDEFKEGKTAMEFAS